MTDKTFNVLVFPLLWRFKLKDDIRWRIETIIHRFTGIFQIKAWESLIVCRPWWFMCRPFYTIYANINA